MSAGTEHRILDAIMDPVVVVEADGVVRLANRAAERLFGCRMPGRTLAEMVADPPEEVSAFLRRSARSGSPMVGAVSPSTAKGKAFNAWGRRLAPDDMAVVLHIELVNASEFTLLSEKVRQLNGEIAQRRRTQAVLEEALRHNQLLLRELNHRVKNNIQMLAGLFGARMRQPGPPELHAFLGSAVRRMMAIGNVQRLMYEESSAGQVPLDTLMAAIVGSLRAIVPDSVELEVDCPPVELPSEHAHPVALIINELVTNALKHGVATGGRVRAGACRRNGELVLFVEDDGPGMPDVVQGSSASGLRLVRGLARQIGGKVVYVNGKGLKCEVSFVPQPVKALS